ncbi:MAG: hypothetical protein LBE12_20590 [Planctomycetaceae bacterium]|jgi:hypothetical protein|nr:hypothetical protein [Planctomycetaceae bacterium]
MTNYFSDGRYFTKEPAWSIIGTLAPTTNPIVNTIYPMEMMTKFHQTHHIAGLTGRWMDTLPGHIHSGGWYHRINHGHHLFNDGIKVLKHPKLNFGEFLHHLGMDSLTKAGIPNPLFPTETMLKGLQRLGMSASTASELLTVNVPKLLGGGLSLLVAGHDVYACFSDTIPHTFLATGYHLGIGAIDLMFACYPPNPFVMLSGVAEIGVGTVTGIRTLIDTFNPTTISIFDSTAVCFPVWAETAALSALFGACVGYWSGKSIDNIAKGAGITVISSITAASISGMLAGNFVAPFIGGIAGFATGLLLRKIFMSYDFADQQRLNNKFHHTDYFGKSRYFNNYSQYFGNIGQVVPIMQLPSEPIGTLKDGKLLLDKQAIAKQFERK